MSYAPQGEGVFAWPIVLTFPMKFFSRSSPGGKSMGSCAQFDPACEGHQSGAAPAGEPGVSTLEFGSFGLYVANGCVPALTTSPVVGFSFDGFGGLTGPVGYTQYELV